MSVKPLKVGLIGCGDIAHKAYIPSILRKYSMIDVVKCTDLNPERAAYFNQKFGIPTCKDSSEIIDDPEIEAVLNLTYPSSHAEITKAALAAGKHVYTEKMMGVTWADAAEIVKVAEAAEKKGIWYTQAPDTFLGGVWQTARKFIDDGSIGKPIAVLCVVNRGTNVLGGSRGESTRRPVPAEFSGMGMFGMPNNGLPAGPDRGTDGSSLPFDMGGYYLHNMINMFGNVRRVTGFSRVNVKSAASTDPLNTLYKNGIPVNEPDTIIGTLEFDSGVIGSIIFVSNSDVMTSQFTVYGSEANLICPDPNFYGEPLYIQTANGIGMQISDKGIPLPPPTYPVVPVHNYLNESRGVGLMDMAFAIRNGRKPRCHYSMGYQAFEIVHGIIDSCETGNVYQMVSKVERPAAVRPGIISAFGSELGAQAMFDD